MKTLQLYSLLILIASVVFYADFNLIYRVKNFYIDADFQPYPFLKDLNEYKGWISCDINPVCDVTVKGLTTDHINFYVLGPAAILLNDVLELDKIQKSVPNCINIPNAISISHAIVGLIAGFFISSSKLKFRRVGVVLFELRTLLDHLGECIF
jgi:hypothetical protein